VSKSILVLNGPNLNLLGTREPDIYGKRTLADIEQDLRAQSARLGVALDCFQSNHEGELVDRVQSAALNGIDFIVVNAGGLTHTSVALRDALAGVGLPFIEVHISNVHRRESFRQVSLLADAALGSIVGLGPAGYRLAVEFAADYEPPGGRA
jgi:3-dehydroquinate dehydratase II